MLNEKVTACMVGESIFRIGDRTSLAYGWGRYKNIVSVTDIINLKIVDMYYLFEDNSYLPKFKAIVETLTNKKLEVDIMDLNEVRSAEENRQELDKAGYNFGRSCIYSKGYETGDGKWVFYDINITDNREANIQVV